MDATCTLFPIANVLVKVKWMKTDVQNDKNKSQETLLLWEIHSWSVYVFQTAFSKFISVVKLHTNSTTVQRKPHKNTTLISAAHKSLIITIANRESNSTPPAGVQTWGAEQLLSLCVLQDIAKTSHQNKESYWLLFNISTYLTTVAVQHPLPMCIHER